MHDRTRPMFRNQPADEIGVGDVTLDEVIPRLTLKARKILQIPGVGQRIQINDSLAGRRGCR